MPSIDEVLDQVEPREVAVSVATRGDLVGRIREAQAELAEALAADARSNLPDAAPGIRRRLEQLAEDLRASQVEFRFRGLPSSEWKALLRAHPPSDEDRLVGYDYDPDTFPPEAIAASCVEPTGVTAAKVRDLVEVMTFGVFRQLWDACLAANVGVEDDAIPFTAAAFGAILDSPPSSTTAASEESPTASSSGE